MIYDRWMSYIKDGAGLTKLVMPGAHNAGSRRMSAIACCQDGDMFAQFTHGVRHFCVRIGTDYRGRLVMRHGLAKGRPVEEDIVNVRRMMEANDSEFVILDIREYYPQKYGPFAFNYKADPQAVDALVAKHLEPEKYALTGVEDISKVTMGDIRRSGKRYLLYNYRAQYRYSVNCEYIFPWDKDVHGMSGPDFAREAPRFFDRYSTGGLFWFQTQLTPNTGTPMGMASPKKLDVRETRPVFKQLIASIAANPHYLDSANIISGDFMSVDFMKAREILMLNLAKNLVREDLAEEYRAGLG